MTADTGAKPMSRIAASNDLGSKILKLLGIDSTRVVEFRVKFKAGFAVEVDVRRIAESTDESAINDLKPEFEKYKLVPIEEEEGNQ